MVVNLIDINHDSREKKQILKGAELQTILWISKSGWEEEHWTWGHASNWDNVQKY